MSAFEEARYCDYIERLSKGETLSAREQREYNYLYDHAVKEYENEPSPRFLGGDYPDVF